jgi:hypothetical protein
MKRGVARGFDYDIALSFASEDREAAKTSRQHCCVIVKTLSDISRFTFLVQIAEISDKVSAITDDDKSRAIPQRL